MYHKIKPCPITFFLYNHCKDMMLSSVSLDNGDILISKIRAECKKEERVLFTKLLLGFKIEIEHYNIFLWFFFIMEAEIVFDGILKSKMHPAECVKLLL